MEKFRKVANFILYKSFFRINEYHKENLMGKRFVLCPNHVSYYDGPVFWVAFKNITIMAKKEFFKNKLVAKTLNKFNIVSVDREAKSGMEVRQAIKTLQEDNGIYMLFPQGTISDINKNTINRVKPGAFYIADRTSLPIVPVFLEQPRMFRKSRIVYGNIIDVNLRNEKGILDKNKLLQFRELWKSEILRLQQEAVELENRPVRIPRLNYKHSNNNNG